MGCEIPKQFLKIQGKEIIIHSLELFEINENIDEIYVACILEGVEFLKQLVTKYTISKVKKVFPGGKSGQDSIFLALSEIKKDYDDAIVLIHDGVRSLVSDENINKCIKDVTYYGSAITVIPCFETPIMSLDDMTVEKMPLRNLMYTAQAPQCFYLNVIYNMHLKERRINPNYEGISDSCGLMVKNGIKCHIVHGNNGNIKVTTPEDYCTLLGNYNADDYKQFMKLERKFK